MRLTLMASLLTLLLVACGQTGPLYLPEPTPTPPATDPLAIPPAEQSPSP